MLKYNLNTISLEEKFEQLEGNLLDLYYEYIEHIITEEQYAEYSEIIFEQLELLGYYK